VTGEKISNDNKRSRPDNNAVIAPNDPNAGNVDANANIGGGIMKGGYSKEEYQMIINNMYLFILLRNVTFVTRELTEQENTISEIYIDPNTKAELLYYKLKQKVDTLNPPLKENTYYTVTEIGDDGVWKFSKLEPEGTKKSTRSLSLTKPDSNSSDVEEDDSKGKEASSPSSFLSPPSPRGKLTNFIIKQRTTTPITTTAGGYKKTHRNGNKNKNKSRKVRKTKRQTKNSKTKTKKHKKIIKHKKHETTIKNNT
jgi:hypothetical protein